MYDPSLNDVQVTYTWNTVHDERVCPICQSLSGYTWTSTGESLFTELFHSGLGTVWNLEVDLSLVHHTHNVPGACRCFIDCNIQVLWEGRLVDYGLMKYEIEQLRQSTAEIAANMQGFGGGAGSGLGAGGYDDFLWGVDRHQMLTKSLGGRGGYRSTGGTDIYDVYHMIQTPSMARRFTQGNLMPYDVLRLGRWSGIAPSVGLMGMSALLLAPFIYNLVQDAVEKATRAGTQAEAIRKRNVERERFKAWNP